METKGKAVDSVIQYQLHKESNGNGESGNPEILIVDVIEYSLPSPSNTKAVTHYYALTSSFNEIDKAINENKLVVFRDKIFEVDVIKYYTKFYYSYDDGFYNIGLYDNDDYTIFFFYSENIDGVLNTFNVPDSNL